MTYSLGEIVAPSAMVVYVGGALPDRNHPEQCGLSPCKTLYYKFWLRDVYGYWSTGDQKNCQPWGGPSGWCPQIDDPSDVQTASGTSRVTLTWNNPADPGYASTLIVRSTSPPGCDAWRPQDDVEYQVAQQVGGGVVVCNFASTRFVDVDLTNLRQYWYSLYSVKTGNKYSWGVSFSATPAKEPDSHHYEFVRQWGSPGSGAGQFDGTWGPRGIAAAPSGMRLPDPPEIHVSDPGNRRIEVFTPSGQFLRHSAQGGFSDYQYCLDDLEFRAVQWDFSVLAFGRSRISCVDTWLDAYEPATFSSKGTYQIPDIGGGRSSYGSVCRTTVLSLYQASWNTWIAAAVSLDNKVWLFKEIWVSPQALPIPVGVADGQLSGPTSIVQDMPDAFLYVGDETGRIQKFGIDGSFRGKVQFPGGDRLSEVPLDMAVDQWGCFYVATSGFKILKFDHKWNFLTGWGRKGTGSGEFGESSEHTSRLRVAVDDSDRVYVSDAVNCRIQVFQESDLNGTDIHYNAFVAEPVNTATGNMSYEHTDLTIPGRGMAMVFSRSYNSQSQYEGTLGPGWRHSYDISLSPKVDGARVMCWGDGREITYIPDPGTPNNYLPASPGIYDALVKNGDNTFTLTTAQGRTRYNFTSDGQLTTIADKNGNTQSLVYNALGRLTTITDSSGRNVTLTYGGNGKLAHVADVARRRVDYGYDSDGNLITAHDPCDNQTQYRYVGAPGLYQMSSIVDARGNTIIANTYDGYRRVEQQTNARDAVTRFEYLTEAISTPYGTIYAYKGITRVTEAFGTALARASEHHYDARGRLLKIVHSDTLTTEYTYDESNNRLTAKDRNGKTTTYTFDSRGNMLVKTDPAPGSGQTTITYDAKNNPLSRKDPTNRTTSYQYDTPGNLTKSIDPLTHETAMAYDAHGQLTTTTDAEGRVQSLAYDANGNVTLKTDPRGMVWQYTYDAVGRKLTQTDPAGAVTRYEYDGCDRITKITDALGQESTFVYDANGNRTSETLPGARTLTYTYDENDHLLTATDAMGATTAYTYDILDRKTCASEPLGRTTQYEYDALDRLMKQTDANGHYWAYTYDGNGNRLTATDPCGTTLHYSYDELNRQITAETTCGCVTTTTYDAAGRVLSVANCAGATTAYHYDACGLKDWETDYRNNTTRFAYDNVGNLISVTDPLTHVTQHAYDANNNRITTTNALGQATTFVYDDVNRLIETRDALNNTITNAYDDLGRLTNVTDPNGHAHVYGYDSAGRLARVTEPTGATTDYTYDKNGNMLTFQNARGKITTYTYDALNRKTSETNPLSLTRQFFYDLMGNLTKMTDEDGADTTYAYDCDDRLTSVAYPGSLTATYAYDCAGRRTQMTDGIGTSAYTYDSLGRRTGYQDPFGKTIGYGYDSNGNRTTLTYPDGKQVVYTYDACNRMRTATDWDGRVTIYDYDDAHRVTRNTLPNGTYCTYGYDAAGRLTSRVNRKPDGTVIAGYTLTLDPAGNRTRIDTEGALQASPEDEDVTYEYDDANRITRANDTTYAFSNRGNMIRKTEPGNVVTEYTYDGRDRLVAVTAPGTNFAARYDGAGNRLETSDDGTIERAVTDDAAPLSQLLCRTDSGGTIETCYVYGPAGTLLYEAPVSPAVRFFHFDCIGSTVALTDGAAIATDEYAYDEFGIALLRTGDANAPFGYAGEAGVAEGGGSVLWMRARCYEPLIGRFLSAEPVPGTPSMPSSLHSHAYVRNSPISRIDPSGERDIGAGLINALPWTGMGRFAVVGGAEYLGSVLSRAASEVTGWSAARAGELQYLTGDQFFGDMSASLVQTSVRYAHGADLYQAMAYDEKINWWEVDVMQNRSSLSTEADVIAQRYGLQSELASARIVTEGGYLAYQVGNVLKGAHGVVTASGQYLAFKGVTHADYFARLALNNELIKLGIDLLMKGLGGWAEGIARGQAVGEQPSCGTGAGVAGDEVGRGAGGSSGGNTASTGVTITSGSVPGSSGSAGAGTKGKALSGNRRFIFQSSANIVPAPVTPETYEPKYRPINKVRAKDMR